MSAYVEIPRPYESAPGRFSVDLVFPVQSKPRAKQHHDAAWTLADVHGVEASTPFALNPRWSYYKEMCGTDEQYGGLDQRRLTVQGSARAVARYLVALERVLDEVEALATRAVRVFGAWKRSVAAEPFLEYEDASTMRVRARQFRADVLRALVDSLDAGARPVGERDSSLPLWEQYGAVAEEVRAVAGGIDLGRADEQAVTAQMLRMVPESEAGRATVEETERLAVEEAAQLDAEQAELSRVVVEAATRAYDGAEAERLPRDGQMGLFPEAEARRPVVVPAAVRSEVRADRRRYAPAA